MFLSRLILDGRSRAARRDLADPYEMHRTLCRSLPEGGRDEARLLWRLDVDRRIGVPTVIVQSRTQPDWEEVFESDPNRDYLASEPNPNPATKPLDLFLNPGQILAFRLRANPTVKRDGKRHGLFRTEDQIAWLKRKGAAAGFSLDSVIASPEGTRRAFESKGADRRRLSHYAVRFDGRLIVRDLELLHGAIRDGIGAGKAFGFGLLSLARPG